MLDEALEKALSKKQASAHKKTKEPKSASPIKISKMASDVVVAVDGVEKKSADKPVVTSPAKKSSAPSSIATIPAADKAAPTVAAVDTTSKI